MADTATTGTANQVQTSSARVCAQGDTQCMKLKCSLNPPKTIVPVIYIPGIFGSRLEDLEGGNDKEKRYVWDPDRTSGLTTFYTKGFLAAVMQRYWSDKDIGDKARRLHNPKATVMKDHCYNGVDNDNSGVTNDILSSKTFTRLKKIYDLKTMKHNAWEDYDENGFQYTDLAKQVANEEYDRRSKRGWYGVWNSYKPMLETLNELSDPEFIYPVYAFGYDWRFDLDKAANKLVDKIAEVKAVQDYPDFGERGQNKDYDKIHPKVIIVTHSQGSIMARYAMTKLGAEGDVQAVIHLDQPTTGAPVLYRRFITGTAPERSFFGFTDNVFSEILGNNPYHFTRMAAPLTGALSLLPTNDYVEKEGDAKFKWMIPNDPRLNFGKPVSDVYTDVYLGEEDAKWSLINCKRYDKDGNPNPYQERDFDIVQYPYAREGEGLVQRMREPRHTFGDGPLPPGATILPPPADNPYRRDNYRLKPHKGQDKDEFLEAQKYWKEFTKKINSARDFHANLGLAKHKVTRVVSANGKATVTQVTFNLDKTGLLECPLLRGKDGDGTVPLASQEALLQQGAQSAGKVIEGGEHAAICGHPEALKQVTALLTGEFVKDLRATTCQG